MQLGASDRLWLHHTTRRPEAEALLRSAVSSGKDGAFLIRAKREDLGVYALDVACSDPESGEVLISHHVINRAPGGNLLMDNIAYDRLMTLEDLVAYLRKPRNKAFGRAIKHGVAPSEPQVADRPKVQSAA